MDFRLHPSRSQPVSASYLRQVAEEHLKQDHQAQKQLFLCSCQTVELEPCPIVSHPPTSPISFVLSLSPFSLHKSLFTICAIFFSTITAIFSVYIYLYILFILYLLFISIWFVPGPFTIYTLFILFISLTCVKYFFLTCVLSIYCFEHFYLFRLTPGPSPNFVPLTCKCKLV